MGIFHQLTCKSLVNRIVRRRQCGRTSQQALRFQSWKYKGRQPSSHQLEAPIGGAFAARLGYLFGVCSGWNESRERWLKASSAGELLQQFTPLRLRPLGGGMAGFTSPQSVSSGFSWLSRCPVALLTKERRLTKSGDSAHWGILSAMGICRQLAWRPGFEVRVSIFPVMT